MATVDKNTFASLLEHGVEEVIDRPSLEQKLRLGKTLTVKLGADPSSPDLHLGHALVLRKLKEFQNLGHRIVFIIGDFTSRIGDPSGRKEARLPLSKEEVEKNAETYFRQAGKILDLEKTEIRYNSEWFSKMQLADFIAIAAKFSLRRIMDREDFARRLASNEEVFLHEALYQVLQSYDSIAIGADIELGGRDQRLNLLAARELQKKMGKPEQDIMLMPLLIGIDGEQKMSKSLKNYIALTDSAEEMFGKCMSIPDKLILRYAEYAACFDPKDMERARKKAARDPYEAKMETAQKIAALYYGSSESIRAKKVFRERFQKHGASAEVYEEKKVSKKTYILAELLVAVGGAASKSEARRLVLQHAVEHNHKIIFDPNTLVTIGDGVYLRIGKKNFFKVVPE